MLKRRLWVLALMILMLALSGLAQAADERFAVEVSVDVTAANASAAREKAMNEANRAAIVAVSKRISTTEGAAKLSALTDDQLINFIKEVSVVDEKTSPVRYIADLRVVINENLLKEYMKEREIPLLIQSHTRVLVVPIFREFVSDRPLLWESNNLWRQAWSSTPTAQAVQFIPLPSDATNYSLIDAYKAQAVDGEALDKLMRYNHTDDVYVLDAMYDGIEGVEVKATSYRGDSLVVRVAGDRSQGLALLQNAAIQTAAQIESRIKQQSLQETTQESQATVIFSFGSLRQWVQAEQVLRSIPYVKNLEIQAMGTNKAQFKLQYVGSTEKLLGALRSKGYQLVETGKYFLLEKLGD